MEPDRDSGAEAAPVQEQPAQEQTDQERGAAAQALFEAAIAEFSTAYSLNIAASGGVINALQIAVQQAVQNVRLNCLIQELIACKSLSGVNFASRLAAALQEQAKAMRKVQIATAVGGAMRKKGN